MTAKEETKQNHQSSTNIHITQTGARTHATGQRASSAESELFGSPHTIKESWDPAE
jgi:hypothetical protein